MQGANMVLQLLNLVVTGLQWGGGLYASFGLIQLIQGLKIKTVVILTLEFGH